ncbi:Histone-lysine N-methyltransferase EZH1 [Grifola frondosa]|uniref:Histone-lysine N-methyltransferase EZH1 n=1 Tax=Grifola frondosa TaxID=5627 RepID=A0A1C7MMU6_GRIFR|nr:Histone-lysine N-methyltransferase EZH1 [Grifola frondosa]
MEGPLYVDQREPDERASRVEDRLNRFAEEGKRERDIRNTVRTVLKDVWSEFYAWKPDKCRQLLRELTVLSLSEPTLLDDLARSTLGAHVDDMAVDSEDSTELSFTTLDFDRGGQYTLMCQESPFDWHEDYPKYEACTPSAQNIRTDNDASTADFIPYDGEDGFDSREFVLRFGYLAWQLDPNWHDPDAEVIAIEAAARLINEDKFPVHVIDRQRILPRLRIVGQPKDGLLSQMSQRDLLLSWPGARSTPELQSAPGFPQYSLWDQVTEHIDRFCPNPNCLEVLCLTHKEPNEMIDRRQARIGNSDLRLINREPCGPLCFLLVENNDSDVVAWMPDQIVEDVLNMFPDVICCELAKICRKSCNEIFLQRCQIVSDDNLGLTAELMPNPNIKFLDDVYTDERAYEPIDFCKHAGPCDNLNCRLRFKGCRCKNNQKAQVEYHRGQSNTAHSCSNQMLQHDQYPLLEVKIAKYGMGTFATQHINANRCVGEYVAELFPNENILEMLHRHRHLNYSFNLNGFCCLDAVTVGNETRCINCPEHDHKDQQNVDAKVVSVNGEHRIKFVTEKRIRSGQELLWYYGDAYWGVNGPNIS